MFDETTWRARLVGIARHIIRYWAVLGGFILVSLVLMAAASAMSRILFDKTLPGDYDLVRHGVAIAVFTFLPFTQLTFGNITVDVFTERAGARAKAAMSIVGSLLAAGLAVLLCWRMWFGMWETVTYGETMISIHVPVWTAYPPALLSLALLFVAALITIGEGVTGVRTGRWAH